MLFINVIKVFGDDKTDKKLMTRRNNLFNLNEII